MPLFGNPKRTIKHRLLCPSSLRGLSIEDGERHFFYYPFTNELFYDYNEYVNRVILYKQQIWQCAYTLKDNLTYEEALRCERKHIHRLIHEKYPRHVLRPICEMIYRTHSTDLNVLVNQIFDAFQQQYLPGEEVMCRFEGARDLVAVRILRMCYPPNGSYEVAIINTEIEDEEMFLDDTADLSSVHVVHTQRLFRDQYDLTRVGLLQWLRDWTFINRSNKIELKPVLTEYFKLDSPADSPENLALLRFALDQQSLAAPEMNAQPTTTRKRSSLATVITTKLGPVADSTIVNRSGQYADDQFPVTIPYSGTDNNLYILLPQHLIDRALTVWNFCFAFREYIECSSFSFYDFQQALRFNHEDHGLEDPSPLLHSVLSSLLIFLLTKDKSPQNKPDTIKVIHKMKKKFNEILSEQKANNPNGEHREAFSNISSRRVVDINDAVYRLCDNWKDLETIVLKEFWAMFLSKTTSETHPEYDFDEGQFFELGPQQRLFVLNILIEQCLNREITKQVLKYKQSTVRNQKMLAIAEEFSTVNKVPCRTTHLGIDRFKNYYWFFPGFAGSLFVAKPERDVHESDVNPTAVKYGIVSSEKQLDELLGWLDPNGIDECNLKSKIKRKEQEIREHMRHAALMEQIGDSDAIKEELLLKRKDLEERAASLKEEEENEEEENEEEEESDEIEEEEEDEDKEDENDPRSKKPYNTRGKPKKKVYDDEYEDAKVKPSSKSSTDASERRSQRIQKRKPDVKEELPDQPPKKRAKAAATAAPTTPATQKRQNGKSEKKNDKEKQAATQQKQKVKKEKTTSKSTQEKEGPLFPKFLSVNSHRYFINMYDFGYLLSVEEERAKAVKDEEEEEVKMEQND